MGIKSKLRDDYVKNSDIVTNFFIENFYKKFCSTYEIVTDAENQYCGIDSIFKYNDTEYICDEKSAIRYINRNLQTFSLELAFINRGGEVSDGWYVNDNEKNNCYLFVWIDKANVNEKNLLNSMDDLESVEIALVRKDRIQEYLDSLGWTKKNLKKKCEKIMKYDYEPLRCFEQPEVRFTYSLKLVEKPVNILIQRKKLTEISDFTFYFNKN